MSNATAKPLIFIHSKVDDADLTANELRVLFHLSRRAGSNGICKPGIRSIARKCRINKGTAQATINNLEAKRFINVSRSDKTRSVHNYTLTIEEGIAASVPMQGTDGKASVPIQGTDESASVPIECTHLSQSDTQICPNPRHERISKGNPIKENASLGSFAPLATQGAQLPFSSEAFNKCWNQWITHCKERGTKITATQTELLFDKLKTWGEVKTIEAINHSITSGWHSIQEAHQKRETSKNEEPPKKKYVPLVL
jgi:hypothetical protein